MSSMLFLLKTLTLSFLTLLFPLVCVPKLLLFYSHPHFQRLTNSTLKTNVTLFLSFFLSFFLSLPLYIFLFVFLPLSPANLSLSLNLTLTGLSFFMYLSRRLYSLSNLAYSSNSPYLSFSLAHIYLTLSLSILTPSLS